MEIFIALIFYLLGYFLGAFRSDKYEVDRTHKRFIEDKLSEKNAYKMTELRILQDIYKLLKEGR
jgi:hypothetical protein